MNICQFCYFDLFKDNLKKILQRTVFDELCISWTDDGSISIPVEVSSSCSQLVLLEEKLGAFSRVQDPDLTVGRHNGRPGAELGFGVHVLATILIDEGLDDGLVGRVVPVRLDIGFVALGPAPAPVLVGLRHTARRDSSLACLTPSMSEK